VLVHNRCSNFELVSPAYFGRDAIWIRFPDQKVDANAITRASFGRNIEKDDFESALIYKIQRKCRKSNNQSGADNTFTEDASTSLQLLVIWRFSRFKFSARVLLIKHSNAITWNEDTLEKLYSMYLGLLRDKRDIKDIWLLDDTTVLTTTSKWKGFVDYATKITISEGTREDNAMGPLGVPSSLCV
jgi:hypothetical protein